MKKIILASLMFLVTGMYAQTSTTKPKTTTKPTTSSTKPVSKTTTGTTTKSSSTKSTTSKSTTTKKTSTQTTTKTTSQSKPATSSTTKSATSSSGSTTQSTPTPPPTQKPSIPAQPSQPTPAPSATQTPTQQSQTATTAKSQSHIESVWISGSIGGGAVVSTNIVNSGALFPFNTELLFQTRHHRCGIGFASELYVTPESLTRLALGQGAGVKKLFFTYEAFIFRNFPINLGFSSHIGFFGTSENSKNDFKTKQDSTTARGGMFGNVGAVFEIGIRPVYFFVRPSLEYKSWSGFHKEIIATASFGLRFKFLTDYEIKRRAERKKDRDNKH